MTRRTTLIAGAVAAAAAATGGGLAAAFGGGDGPPPLTGVALDRPVPAVPLVDEHGRPASLRMLRGRVVVLAPSLTFCHEVCPITSGALEQIRYDVGRAGLGDRVAVVEVSVDPWRDTPARLRAYRRSTDVTFGLLTGTRRNLERFWRTFGVAFYPQGTGASFDVAHTDGLFLLDARGRYRVAIVGMPDVDGRLARPLKRLLGAEGLRNLRRPRAAWTVGEALGDLGRLLGRRIPEAPLP